MGKKGGTRKRKKGQEDDDELVNLIFSWSLQDVANQDLFRDKVCNSIARICSARPPFFQLESCHLAEHLTTVNVMCISLSQVNTIPDRFFGLRSYLDSFRAPLLEEIRAEMSSTLDPQPNGSNPVEIRSLVSLVPKGAKGC